MVSDRMVTWNGNRMIHEAVRNDNRHHVRRTGYYCKVTRLLSIIFDAVKVSIFILFSKNTDACCRKGQLMEYILLLVGFILLIKGADFFVEGSSSLAGILKVPSVIIGLTIVAMGTSAPEASVSINAALAGSNDIAISNVVGSNIFNGLVVVGICAFLHSFVPHGEILKRDMPLNILVTIVLCLMFLDGSLSRIEGAVLAAWHGRISRIYDLFCPEKQRRGRTRQDSLPAPQPFCILPEVSLPLSSAVISSWIKRASSLRILVSARILSD